MIKKIDFALLCLKEKVTKTLDSLLHEEKGAADIVAIMVVIVILLAVAVIFKDQLSDLVNKVFKKALDWVDSN